MCPTEFVFDLFRGGLDGSVDVVVAQSDPASGSLCVSDEEVEKGRGDGLHGNLAILMRAHGIACDAGG